MPVRQGLRIACASGRKGLTALAKDRSIRFAKRAHRGLTQSAPYPIGWDLYPFGLTQRTRGPSAWQGASGSASEGGGRAVTPRGTDAAVSDTASRRYNQRGRKWRPQRDSNPCVGLRGVRGASPPPAHGRQPCPTRRVGGTQRRGRKWRPQRDSNPRVGLRGVRGASPPPAQGGQPGARILI